MGFKSVKQIVSDRPKGNPPALTLRASGGLKVSCWQNEHKGNDGKPFVTFSALPARGYYNDEKKEFNDTHSLRECDLLPMAELLRSLWTQIQEAKSSAEIRIETKTSESGALLDGNGNPVY